MNNTKPKAICILGMHRSGTSALTRAINLLGAYLGEEKDLIVPQLDNLEKFKERHSDNPEGFWERIDIGMLHDRLLGCMKRNWHSVAPLHYKWQLTDEVRSFGKEILNLIKDNFKDKELWMWKDPRTSLLLPLWKDVLDELGVELKLVLAVRNPLDVAKSLEKRDGFPRDKSFGIWFNYNVLALRSVAGLPLVFVSYDRLIEDWEKELKHCAAGLSISWPEDDSELKKSMKTFIHPELRHSVTTVDDLLAFDAPRPVKELYQLLNGVLSGKTSFDMAFASKVERLATEFSDYSRFYECDMDQLWELGERLNVSEAELNLQKQLRAETEIQLTEKDKEIASFREKSNMLESQLKASEERTRNKDREIASLREKSKALENRLTDILHSKSWQVTVPLRAVGGLFTRKPAKR